MLFIWTGPIVGVSVVYEGLGHRLGPECMAHAEISQSRQGEQGS